MIDEAKCIDIYLKQQDKNLKEATIKAKLKVIKQFLDYCIANEIGDIRNIQKNDVYSFGQFKNWASQSRSTAQFTIRDFFNVMKKLGLVDYDGYELYPIIFTNKRSKILSYYSPEEISKIIISAERFFRKIALIFLAYIAYDIQLIKKNMFGIENEDNLVIYGALQLYLDFINLFIRLLRFFGKSKD